MLCIFHAEIGLTLVNYDKKGLQTGFGLSLFVLLAMVTNFEIISVHISMVLNINHFLQGAQFKIISFLLSMISALDSFGFLHGADFRNEFHFSEVCRSVNYIGSWSKYGVHVNFVSYSIPVK